MTEATAEATTYSEKVQGIVDQIGALSVLELAELKKCLEDTFGVEAAVGGPMMMAPMAGGAGGGGGEVVEKTSFDVMMTSAGGEKIQVIKLVREITSLGLKEAKALVDSVPAKIKGDVPKAEAEEIKNKLVAAGATIELK